LWRVFLFLLIEFADYFVRNRIETHNESVPVTTPGLYVSTTFQNSNVLVQNLQQLSCRTSRNLTSILYADISARDLTLDPTSPFLLLKILVTGPFSSCKIFCSSIDDRRISSVSLFLWFPFSKICHFLLPADPPTSSPLTPTHRCPSRLFPLPFTCSQSLAKSPSSIQLFGSTELSPKAFATQNTCSYNIYNSLHISGNMKICMYAIYE